MNTRRVAALLRAEPSAELLRAIMRPRGMGAVPSVEALAALEPDAKSIVYFIRCGASGPIKIGIALDIRDRLSALQVGCPYDLELLGTIRGGVKAEAALHRAFAAFRLRGEWFGGCSEVRSAVKALLKSKRCAA